MRDSANSDLVPGAFYRDLDGTRVCLVRISRELCTWVAVGDEAQVQVTHASNFRRRFQRWREEGRPEAASGNRAA